MNDEPTADERLEEESVASGELRALYEETLKDIREGQVVKGHIVAITPTEIVVDVGYKSEGAIPKFEFADAETLQVGDEVEVLLEAKETEDGSILLSKRKAERSQGWDRVITRYSEGDLVEGTVARRVKGGLIVDVGMEAFLPASHVALRGFPNLDQFIGQTLTFKIIKINRLRKNVVVSRREYLQKEAEERRSSVLGTLERGQRRKGVVKNITDFGAFVDLGGVDGLLHITDMSWGRIKHPSEVVNVGQELEVVVLDFDKEQMRVSLGLKQTQANPWSSVADKYPVGSRLKGRVVNLVPYGAFVELERGVEGLIHISEFSWTRRVNDPAEVLTVAQEVEVVVLSVDPAAERISLGLKQTLANPWLELDQHHPVGSHVTGLVRNLTEYGAFVEIQPGIDGLIHVKDMSWTRRVNHPQEVVKKGQEVEAVVLAIDAENRKIALGLKQLIPDPWPEILGRFPIGSVVSGRVTKAANFGVFVELEKDIEGLVHVSELDRQYAVGDAVMVRVIKVDGEGRKIGLTTRGVSTP